MKSHKSFLLFLLLAPLAPSFIVGQATEGTILGTVRDETGAVLPAVDIKVTNMGTNLSRTLVTDDGGAYRVPNLAIGMYQVEAELVGFKRQVVKSVLLSISEAVRVDFTLKLGEVSQEITVSASADRVRTESAELAYHFRERLIQDLPLNGRVYLSLAQLVPGANAGLNDRRRSIFGAAIVVGGGRAETNNYLIDGISNNEERIGGFMIAPSAEAVQEFKVQASQYSAEFGNAGGAVINLSTKSGTNTFHGSIFEFHRNSALDARNFFDPRVLPFIRNQFGGAIGGPIRRDRAFFFFNYEGARTRQSITRFGNVPEPDWIHGDFSRAPFRIYNPTNARPDPNTPGRIIREPFPGNVIPPNQINPIGKKIAAAYAAPSFSEPGSPFNFRSTNSRPINQNQFNGRVDHNVGSLDQLFGRYSYNKIAQFDAGLGAFPGSDGMGTTNEGVQLGISETHIFGPNFLNELRLGYSYLDLRAVHADQGSKLGRDLGIPGLYPTPLESGFPGITIRNLSATSNVRTPSDPGASGGLAVPSEARNETFQFIETMSWNRGKHGFKFGSDIQRLHISSIMGMVGGASLAFDGRYTSAASGQRAEVGLADLLLGLPSSMQLSRSFDLGRYRYWNLHLFIQDDWQISPNWTMNLGLRYELQTPAREIRGRESSVDIQTGVVQIQRRAVPFLENVVGVRVNELPFPVETKETSQFYRADLNNFAPRVGFAYRPFGSNHTSIRLGAGTFYVSALANVTTTGAMNPPFQFSQTRVGDPVVPNLSLSDGFPATIVDALRTPSLQNLDADRAVTGYYNKWSLSIQHQLNPRVILETSYVGHTAPKLYAVVRENRPQPGPGPILARRKYPQLGLLSLIVPVNTSTYHAWLNQLRMVEWKGFSAQVSYTFSKSIDNQSALGAAGDGKGGTIAFTGDVKADKARASFDGAHRFTLSSVYSIPQLQGRSSVVRSILGGWQISGILTLQSGFPFQINLADDVANIGDTTSLRPNRFSNGNLPSSQRRPDRWFDTSAFAVPDQFTFGNAGRNIIEQDGIKNLDFALMRNVLLRSTNESNRLQFRIEAFNLLNNVNFDRPLSTIARPGFGRVTSAADARQIQLGLKYIF